MSPDEMFFAYRMLNPSASDYGHCLFSSIASSILSGTASSAAVAEETFTLTGDELPSVGDIQCVTGEDGSALALVRLTAPTGKPVGFWWIGLHHVRTPFSGFGTRATAQST